MRKGISLLCVIAFLSGCGGKGNNPAPVLKPVSAVLGAPAQNAVCTTGTIISTTQSSIAFTWTAASNTNSYNLIIENLLTQDSTVQNTSQTQIAVTLLRNTPYAWYVVSKSTQTTATAQSAVWKFYNSGAGVVSYAPFPAEIVSPTLGQTVSASQGTVNLTWTGSDVLANSIANYDVYFGTTITPPILKSSISDSFLNSVPVTSNTTYYWKVITKDFLGNTSDSGVYQFSVD
jgi:hypothetical protein